MNLALCFRWFFLPDALADRELHLAGLFVRVNDHVIAVQHLAVENLQCQRVLHELLDRPLQRTRSEVRIVALR